MGIEHGCQKREGPETSGKQGKVHFYLEIREVCGSWRNSGQSDEEIASDWVEYSEYKNTTLTKDSAIKIYII